MGPQRTRPAGERSHPSLGPPRGAALVGLFGLAVVLLVHLRSWSFLCDDAFISFRYARNLAEHGALVYNVNPLEFVEGYSNPLWVLLLALGASLGLPPERLAPVLTALASLTALVLLPMVSARIRRIDVPSERDPAFELIDLAGPALLVFTPEFVVWASSGLETSTALALGLAACLAWLRGRVRLAAGLAALAGLTRLDSLAWIGCFGLAWLGLLATRPQLRAGLVRREILIGAGIFVSMLGAALLARHAYYGRWLPNTWAIKQHGALLRGSVGVEYVRAWIAGTGLAFAAPLLLFSRPAHVLAWLPLLAQIVWAWSIGGDFMAYSRFLLPATALAALTIALALDGLRVRLATRRGAGIATGLLLILAGACAWRLPARVALDREHPHLRRDIRDKSLPGFESVSAMDHFARVRLIAGERLREAVPPDTWISVGAAGALPYASGLPAFDAYGLVDPSVLEDAKPAVGVGVRPGHQIHATLAHVLAREPDLMCHLGVVMPEHPPAMEARRRAGADWRWACVETGPVEDRRGQRIENLFYCCLRPRDRFRHLDPGSRE